MTGAAWPALPPVQRSRFHCETALTRLWHDAQLTEYQTRAGGTLNPFPGFLFILGKKDRKGLL
jgi:hypothetical protein